MKVTALIMAGGRGERFWPLSRADRPKQFLDLTGEGKTMIRQTVDRILPVAAPEDIFVATNAAYGEMVREQLPEIPEQNLILEPAGRNTAPCIGLAAMKIRKKYEDALMIVLPSDHLIRMPDRFLETLRTALTVAEEGNKLVTLGITPAYPETAYGYIRYDAGSFDGRAYRVDRFVEKPELERAVEYLMSGEYVWNSGMFIWKVSSILSSISRFLPDTFRTLEEIAEAFDTPEEENSLKTLFPGIRSESVDYGIMEKAEEIYTIPGSFGWDDVGSWRTFERIRTADEDGNVCTGNCIAYESTGNIIRGGKKLIAAVGVSDLVIVDTEDVLLVAKKDRTDGVKQILKELREEENTSFL